MTTLSHSEMLSFLPGFLALKAKRKENSSNSSLLVINCFQSVLTPDKRRFDRIGYDSGKSLFKTKGVAADNRDNGIRLNDVREI